MKKTLSLLTVIISVMLSTSCIAADDAWKSNIVTVDLTNKTASSSDAAFDGSILKITKGGDYELKGILEDGYIYVNSEEKVKLRLSGVSITNSTGPAIYYENALEALITITENTKNYLCDSKNYTIEGADAALFSNDDMEIKGKGKLTVTGSFKHGIASDDDLKIENGNITITSFEHGIKVNDTFKLLGGDLDITSQTGKGIKAGLEVIIEDGYAKIISLESEGIESKGTLTVTGGELDIQAFDDGINTGNEDTSASDNTISDIPNEGFGKGTGGMRGQRTEQGNSEAPKMPYGDMPFMPDGEVPENPDQTIPRKEMPNMMPSRERPVENPNMNAQPPEKQTGTDTSSGAAEPQTPAVGYPSSSDGVRGDKQQGGFGRGNNMGRGFGFIDAEAAVSHAITVSGGSIKIKAGGDGIDSNGNLTISGGTVIIDGPEKSGNGPLDSEGTMSITGGTVITLSSSGMLQLPSGESNQNILRYSFATAIKDGDTVSVKDSYSTELMSHISRGSARALIFSSDSLTLGNTYTILLNGNEVSTVTLSDSTNGFGGFHGESEKNFRENSENQNREPSRNTGQNYNATEQNTGKITVSLNGKELSFETDPVIRDGTTLVGFRSIFEALGCEVSWDDITKTATAKKDGTVIILTIGSKKSYVNGITKELLQPPEIIGSSTMVPVRFISEELGLTVDWDGNKKSVSITDTQNI